MKQECLDKQRLERKMKNQMKKKIKFQKLVLLRKKLSMLQLLKFLTQATWKMTIQWDIKPKELIWTLMKINYYT